MNARSKKNLSLQPRTSTQNKTPTQTTKTTMMKQAAFFLALAASSASAIELTPDNYEAETDGKSVFLKFFAPWVSRTINCCLAMQHWQLAWAGLNINLRICLAKQWSNITLPYYKITVRTLQEAKARLGQAHRRLRGICHSIGGRCWLYCRRKRALRSKWCPWIPHPQVGRSLWPPGLPGKNSHNGSAAVIALLLAFFLSQHDFNFVLFSL